ncbi:hypothetical protein ACIRPS_08575, partial [Streptomyces griseoviridis]
MRDTPRPQGTVGDNRSEPPQPRPGRALAHTPGVSGSGSPHRSDSRSPQTPRGGRRSGPGGGGGPPPPPPPRAPPPAPPHPPPTRRPRGGGVGAGARPGPP